MATSRYVAIDVSKDRLDVAVLGEERGWQVNNTPKGIAGLVEQMQELQPELMVVEALFWVGLAEPCSGETIRQGVWSACQDR